MKLSMLSPSTVSSGPSFKTAPVRLVRQASLASSHGEGISNLRGASTAGHKCDSAKTLLCDGFDAYPLGKAPGGGWSVVLNNNGSVQVCVKGRARV